MEAHIALLRGGRRGVPRHRSIREASMPISAQAVQFELVLVPNLNNRFWCDRGEGHPFRRAPEGNADRAQGLGHRLRNSQAQALPLPHRSHLSGLCYRLADVCFWARTGHSVAR